MPSWGELLKELKQLQDKKHTEPFDYLRRKYLAELHDHTGRDTVLYATRWTQPSTGIPPEFVSITEEDVHGLMEAFHGLSSDKLDLILHSPGGSLEATEAVVSYIRSKYSDVRVIIPYAAMSAATMLACSADKIVMGKHSFLGPIDPQMILDTPLGRQSIPAQAILDQFDRAKQECKDVDLLSAWAPMLGQYGPALLTQCQEALDLSKELTSEWLAGYMFKGEQNEKEKAKVGASKLANHKAFKTHGRHINREKARSFELSIDNLEADQRLEDLVLSVFYATNHTFNGTTATKIIENHVGRAFVKMIKIRTAMPRPPQQPQIPPSQPPHTQPAPVPSGPPSLTQ
jgi:hypothetical protein